MNASSGRDATSVSANSECREHVGINTSFENASGNNNTLGVSNVNDETRHNVPDEVSELSVQETQFDRQAHTHHSDQLFFYVSTRFEQNIWQNDRVFEPLFLKLIGPCITSYKLWQPNVLRILTVSRYCVHNSCFLEKETNAPDVCHQKVSNHNQFFHASSMSGKNAEHTFPEVTRRR